MKNKKQVKISRSLFATLLLSNLVLIFSIGNKLTDIDYASANIVKINSHEISYKESLYSDEVDLNSADDYYSRYSKETMILKEKYEDLFTDQLWERLEAMSTYNLQKVLKRVGSAIEATLNKGNISKKKKEKILWQLLALESVIQKIINENKWLSIDIDLEKLMKI